MSALRAAPGALRLLSISVLARLPLAMLGIGVLVHAKSVSGSFAAAGLTAGALAAAQAIGGPLLGRLADRRGQTAVLVVSAVVAAAALVVLAALPTGAPVAALVTPAAVLGASAPPVPACVRALLPGLVGDPEALRRVYAVDSAAVELTWISGPPLVLLLGALWSTGAALAVAGVLLGAFTLLFAAAPASRTWRAPAGDGRPAGSALRSPGVRTLALVLAGAGLVFGATEVAVAAAADGLGHAAAAGPLLGLWGLGGLLGGVAATRAGGGAGSGAGLALLVAALGAAHAAAAATTGSLGALAAALVLAGTLIAPTCASVYAMVDDVARDGTVTEAFAWLATAVAIGTSAGSAIAGAVAEAAGPAPAFMLAGAPAAVAALIAAARATTLRAPQPATA
jgi:MFS family permease